MYFMIGVGTAYMPSARINSLTRSCVHVPRLCAHLFSLFSPSNRFIFNIFHLLYTFSVFCAPPSLAGEVGRGFLIRYNELIT